MITSLGRWGSCKEVLRKGYVSLANQVERLTEAYLRSVIPLVEYQRRRQELEQKQQALVTQERQLEAQGDRHRALARMVTSMEAFCQRVQAGLYDFAIDVVHE